MRSALGLTLSLAHHCWNVQLYGSENTTLWFNSMIWSWNILFWGWNPLNASCRSFLDFSTRILCCSGDYDTPLVFWFLFSASDGIKRLVCSGNRVFYSTCISSYYRSKNVLTSSKCTFCAGSGNYRMTFCSLCTISLLSLLRVAYTIFTVIDNWWVSVRSITTSTVHQPSSISQSSAKHPSVKFKYTSFICIQLFLQMKCKTSSEA